MEDGKRGKDMASLPEEIDESIGELWLAIGVLFETGDVVELRAFKDRTTASGYFDNFEELAEQAATWDSRGFAVYVTLNPTERALLARAHNRVKTHPKSTTTDTNITCRRWLPVDLDPVRPANVSSTDKEKQAAVHRAREVRNYLREQGICDAVAKLLPGNCYYAFESASAKALYYAAEDNPAFLKYHWLYPSEVEAIDLLVELLRPLLSGGKARHRTVNKDQNGRNIFQEFDLEGPISTTIPTVRNKLDKQLLTRLLVAGLEDYPGRIAAHSRAVSEQLTLEHAGEDHTPLIRAWQAALLSLTSVRRVVLPRLHPDFCFDSDEVSHGARLWANVLGLMCAHTWLEQRNREIITLDTGERAIVAKADDYEAAYRVFAATCERSVMNVSDTHRRILTAVWVLQQEQERAASLLDERKYYREAFKPFSQRKIAEASGVPQSTISDNRSYLVQSLKFLEAGSGGGLRPVEGAEPSWWAKGDALDGFPKPEQVRLWWHGADDR